MGLLYLKISSTSAIKLVDPIPIIPASQTKKKITTMSINCSTYSGFRTFVHIFAQLLYRVNTICLSVDWIQDQKEVGIWQKYEPSICLRKLVRDKALPAWLTTSPQVNRPNGKTCGSPDGYSTSGCHQCCQGKLAGPWKILRLGKGVCAKCRPSLSHSATTSLY